MTRRYRYATAWEWAIVEARYRRAFRELDAQDAATKRRKASRKGGRTTARRTR